MLRRLIRRAVHARCGCWAWCRRWVPAARGRTRCARPTQSSSRSRGSAKWPTRRRTRSTGRRRRHDDLDVAVARAKSSGAGTLGGKAIQLHDTATASRSNLTSRLWPSRASTSTRPGSSGSWPNSATARPTPRQKMTHGPTCPSTASWRTGSVERWSSPATTRWCPGRVRGLIHDRALVESASAGDEGRARARPHLCAEASGQLADHRRIRGNGALIEVRDIEADQWSHRPSRDGPRGSGHGRRRPRRSSTLTPASVIPRAHRDAHGPPGAPGGARRRGDAGGLGELAGPVADFKAQSPVPHEAMADIEAQVSAVLLDDLPVMADVMSLDEARRMGALALFGGKYGDHVRVVSIGEWSGSSAVARMPCGSASWASSSSSARRRSAPASAGRGARGLGCVPLPGP